VPSLDIFDGKVRTLLVLDDLMSQVDENISNMFTRGSHHRGISVVFIVQNLFQKNPHARTISLNSQYIVLYKNPRDVHQFSVLARQMGINAKFAREAFQLATSEPHTYLLVDLKPETNDNYRLRANIFPGEQTHVYVDRLLYKPDNLLK
jgi:hypothetical protein